MDIITIGMLAMILFPMGMILVQDIKRFPIGK
jgi:hypothetical protein